MLNFVREHLDSKFSLIKCTFIVFMFELSIFKLHLKSKIVNYHIIALFYTKDMTRVQKTK